MRVLLSSSGRLSIETKVKKTRAHTRARCAKTKNQKHPRGGGKAVPLGWLAETRSRPLAARAWSEDPRDTARERTRHTHMADHVRRMPDGHIHRRTILDPGVCAARGEKVTPRARARPAPARASGGRASGIRERQPTSVTASRARRRLSLFSRRHFSRGARATSLSRVGRLSYKYGRQL